ncbi:MAG: DUF4919 domain-containing protein [Desulfuromonadales bacterium]|nr:DUF4919 domain-containing protein [Desulfuromonadales bacterium]
MMRKSVLTIVGILFLLASFPVCTFSQEAKSRYDVLLERVKKGDQAVDYREMRFAYAETSRYKPYGGNRSDLVKAMYSAYYDKHYAKAVEDAEKILKDNYVDIDAHMMAGVLYDLLGEKAKSDYHGIIGKGLLQSMMASEDGESLKTAIKIISVDEEYILLRMLGLKSISQSKLQIDDHRYDKLTVFDTETNRQLDLYFSIDIPYSWLEKSLKKSK